MHGMHGGLISRDLSTYISDFFLYIFKYRMKLYNIFKYIDKALWGQNIETRAMKASVLKWAINLKLELL